MGDRTDRIRVQQAGPAPTNEEVAASLFAFIEGHQEHPWRQVGRCVVCGPCNVRLYQGTIPKGHPIAPAPPRKATAADQMRERWNMDSR